MDYISLVIKYYKPLVVKYAKSIDEVKLKYCLQTFYGDQEGMMQRYDDNSTLLVQQQSISSFISVIFIYSHLIINQNTLI